MLSRIMKLLMLLCAAAFISSAMAQAEPTLNQIYEAARSGQVDKAQGMMKEVLRAHPKSGKAHYVQAELYARQKQLTLARDELATAEALSPGLAFAKPEAVRALRSELALPSAMSGMTDFKGANPAAPQGATPPARVAPAAPVAPAAASFPWGMLLLGGAIVAAAVIFMRRKQAPVPAPYGAPANASANGMQPGPYGGAPSYGPGQQPSGPGAAPYGAPPAAPGMGGNIMGGLATGLAVGAGVMAAQSLGRQFFGNDHAQNNAANSSGGAQGALDQSQNPDMGGNDFGIREADAGSWDDGGSSMADSGDGGGGWDS